MVLTAARLVELATQDGRWAPVVARAADGAGALAADAPPAAAVKAAERDFRYARGLVAAEDVERWLSQFTLSVGEWREQIRRQVALDAGEAVAPGAVTPREAWAAACCSELLGDIATAQAERVAAALALGEDAAAPAADVVARFRAGAVEEGHIDREIGDNAMRWLRITYDVVTAPNADAAAEARLCLTEDGMSTEEVAQLLGSPVAQHDGWLRDAPADLEDVLLTTAIGGAAPALAREVGFDVVRVADRRQLPANAPELRGAVRDALADRALARQVEDRVRWHVRF